MAITAVPKTEESWHGPRTGQPVVTAARALGEVDVRALDDAELEQLASDLEWARAALAAATTHLLAEAESRDLARRLQWASTADWWTHLAGLRVGAGRRAVEQAVVLVRTRATTLAALRAGSISPEQAAVVVDAVEDLPDSPALRDEAERRLLEDAGDLTASDLARASTRILAELDPDGAERKAEAKRDRLARAAHRRRFLSITDDGAGGVRLRGRGTVEDAATIRAALLPLTAPAGAVDPETGEVTADPRDHGARLWDALVRVAQHALDTELPPSSHGARARVSVTVNLQDLHDASAEQGVAHDHEPESDPTRRPGSQPPPRPGSSSEPPHTDDGLHLTAADARRLACDADVIPVVLGSAGEPLDVGRETRVVSGAIWRALVVRDGGCTFPSCSRPPLMCHAHHVQHWVDGGPTSLDNLALLCGAHHRWIHGTSWEVRISTEDGRPEFLPPAGDSAPGDVHRDAAGDTSNRGLWVRRRRRGPAGLDPTPGRPSGLPPRGDCA